MSFPVLSVGDGVEPETTKPKLKLEDVRGGMRVRVVARADETLNGKLYFDRVGWVDGFDPNTCGSTEADPMLFVRFPGLKTDGFWLEELEAA